MEGAENVVFFLVFGSSYGEQNKSGCVGFPSGRDGGDLCRRALFCQVRADSDCIGSALRLPAGSLGQSARKGASWKDGTGNSGRIAGSRTFNGLGLPGLQSSNQSGGSAPQLQEHYFPENREFPRSEGKRDR